MHDIQPSRYVGQTSHTINTDLDVNNISSIEYVMLWILWGLSCNNEYKRKPIIYVKATKYLMQVRVSYR